MLFRTSGDPVGIEMLEVGIAIGAGRPVVLAGDQLPTADHPAVRIRAGVGMEAAIREAHELSLAVRAPSS